MESPGAEVKQTAAETAERAKAQAGAMLERRKEGFATEAEGVAAALRRTAMSLREEGRGGPIAEYAAKAADSADRISEALRREDLRGLFRRAEDLARREPALFLGGALALGFAFSRFWKSARTPD